MNNSISQAAKTKTWMIIAILILVLLVRFIFVMTYHDGNFHPNGKMGSWPRIALNLASGRGYVYDSEAPTARRGPVPVLFMALLFLIFGPQAFPVPIVLSQWLWDVGSALLIYLIGIELFGKQRVALTAMAMFALHPIIVDISIRVSVEPLATFLLLAFVLTFLRALRHPEWFRFIWPGILLGLSTLSLAILQFFPVLAIGLIIVTLYAEKRKAFLAIVTFCLSLLLVWSPWIIRNYLALDAFVPASTLGGHNLLKNHQTLGETDYLRFRNAREDEEIKRSFFAARGIDLKRLSEVERDKLFRDTALDFILTYPGRYVILSIVRFFRLWFNLGLGLGPNVLSYAAILTNGPLIILALIAYLRFRGNWIKPARLLLVLLAYSTALYMAIAAELRYSIPFTPLVILPSAHALTSMITRLHSTYLCKLRMFHYHSNQ